VPLRGPQFAQNFWVGLCFVPHSSQKLGVALADFDVLCSCVVPGNWTVADVSGLRVLLGSLSSSHLPMRLRGTCPVLKRSALPGSYCSCPRRDGPVTVSEGPDFV
jgi:hypothetical protein